MQRQKPKSTTLRALSDFLIMQFNYLIKMYIAGLK